MSTEQTRAAIDRVVEKRIELGAEDFSAYAIVALSILASDAPEVVEFILDRTDERTEPASSGDHNG